MDKKETYKETHRKLVEAMQEAAMKDESIEFDEDAFERNWLEKLREENDPEMVGLANLIEERIKERE